jgi:MoxR-like ATPase
MSTVDIQKHIEDGAAKIEQVKQEIGKRLIGQEYMVDGMLTGILAGGHLLLEGVPGLAKTLAIRSLAEALDMDFKRIQFTPDLLPADLIGTLAYRYQSGEFFVRKGPVFTNIILADEINRAPAKVQSALLESMEEEQVTIGDTSYDLPAPFFVLATQNPIEHEGTYPLPEAQLDRFLLKLKVEYPSFEEEKEILSRMGTDTAIPIRKVLDRDELVGLRNTIENIRLDERIKEYIVSIVAATRKTDPSQEKYSRFVEYGASPRASLGFFRCAKIRAFFNRRDYVLPEDVKTIAYDILRHRIILSYEAESEELSPEDIIDRIVATVTVP